MAPKDSLEECVEREKICHSERSPNGASEESE